MAGPTIVRGNVIELAGEGDAAIHLDARSDTRLVAEASVTDLEGAAGVNAFAQSAGATVVRDNVFDGSRSF